MIPEVRGSASAQDQHEAIAAGMSSLCQESQYFKHQAQELKKRRFSLEEQRQTLQKENQQLDEQIVTLKSSLEDTTSQCQVLMERTNSLKEKLVVQAKRKKDLHYANLWIRTGTACGAVSHIIRLREDLQKMKQEIFKKETSECPKNKEEILSVDNRVVCGLQRMAKLTESNLAALAKETALTQPGRLTYREKQQVRELLSMEKTEDDETKLLQLTLILCAVSKLDIPEPMETAFLAERDAFFSPSISNECDDSTSSKRESTNDVNSHLSGSTQPKQRKSDVSTNAGSPLVLKENEQIPLSE